MIWMPLTLTEESFSQWIPSGINFCFAGVPIQREGHDFHGQIPCVVWEAPHTTQRNPIANQYHPHRRYRHNG